MNGENMNRHFKTKAVFESVLASGGIEIDDTCYIKETHEIWTHGEFYGSVASMIWMGNFTTANGPYRKGMVVRFNGRTFVAERNTSDAPQPVYTDASGNRYTYQDGGYVLADAADNLDWQEI